MYLIAGNTTLYSFIIRRSIMQLYMASILGLAIFALAWYGCCYVPLQNFITAKEQENVQLRAQQKRITQTQFESKKITARINELKKMCACSLNISANTAACDFLAMLTHTADACKITLTACRFGVHKDEQCYQSYEVMMQARGSFQNIIRFLETIAGNKRILKYTQLELTQYPMQEVHMNSTMQLLMMKEFVR